MIRALEQSRRIAAAARKRFDADKTRIGEVSGAGCSAQRWWNRCFIKKTRCLFGGFWPRNGYKINQSFICFINRPTYCTIGSSHPMTSALLCFCSYKKYPKILPKIEIRTGVQICQCCCRCFEQDK